MECIKIDIVKTLMDVKDRVVMFTVFPDDGADGPVYLEIKSERWEVQTVYEPLGTIRKYLVKVDDLRIWQDLWIIHSDQIKALVFKEINEKGYISRELASDLQKAQYQAGIWVVKRLPWWRRLLNNFEVYEL